MHHAYVVLLNKVQVIIGLAYKWHVKAFSLIYVVPCRSLTSLYNGMIAKQYTLPNATLILYIYLKIVCRQANV